MSQKTKNKKKRKKKKRKEKKQKKTEKIVFEKQFKEINVRMQNK